MLYEKENYLEANANYTDDYIRVKLNGKEHDIKYPENVWRYLDEPIKKSIVDHVAFLSTNYLPLILKKKGIIYNTRLPMMDCFSFKSMLFDLPSSAVLDGKNTVDYARHYFNLDFLFSPEEPIVWSKGFESGNAAIISFTSGKDSLLTLAGMVSRGEVGFIVAGLGLASGVVEQDVYSAILLVIFGTTIISPILLRRAFERT